MPRLLLDDRYRDNPPARIQDDAHAWLNGDDHRFILRALRDRSSAAEIGRAPALRLCAGGDRFWREPKLLPELDFLGMVASAEKDEYRRLVCRDRVKVRLQIERHILSHFVDQDVVDAVLPDDINAIGHPAASVLCCFSSEGMPIVLNIVGRKWRRGYRPRGVSRL